MVTSSSESPPTSYEALRKGNIARNNEMLEKLGLTSRGSATSSLLPTDAVNKLAHPPKRKRPTTEKVRHNEIYTASDVGIVADQPRRSSRRLLNQQQGITVTLTAVPDQLTERGSRIRSSSTATTSTPRKYGNTVQSDDPLVSFYGTHITDMLKEEGYSTSGVYDKWDATRVHQHLTLSKSQRTVVTTGCAGM